ncbi:hypothetical protein H696_04486 [Fonticula alba]|uniref:Uncharacterized protein n=1 Tax=Fonticula alba TaxID=691883 RepID=A0A058Z465_FONAL|nr:hypothetical protein H696_04486 [Fonticula alba]KCV69069.1 hypothetical protein H696_04486 [Fonticula alba]|eukprot:XP_009496640.1 hypothetical protein H696_04486 [Fonticula alba]
MCSGEKAAKCCSGCWSIGHRPPPPATSACVHPPAPPPPRSRHIPGPLCPGATMPSPPDFSLPAFSLSGSVDPTTLGPDVPLSEFAAAWDQDELAFAHSFRSLGFDARIDFRCFLDIRYMPPGGDASPDAPFFGPNDEDIPEDHVVVEVRIPLPDVFWLPRYAACNLRRMESHRINEAGELVVRASEAPLREANLEDCLGQIDRLILGAVALPEDYVPTGFR